MHNTEYLILDEEFTPIIIEDECRELKPIIQDFIQSYSSNKNISVEEFLKNKFREYFPQNTSIEIENMSNEIIESIKTTEEKRKSLDSATKIGISKESWFASELKRNMSAMSSQEAAKYLGDLDSVLKNANESLYRTIRTQAGNVSANPHLDGFIAEQYHVQTFNMNAKATGSKYRAKVLEPTGKGYTKNSVDIVIVDETGKVVKRYQSKYCKDASATERAFSNGDYRGQQKLVPEEQQIDITKRSTNVIEAPDGTRSNALSKSKAERMRDEAQSGNWNELNWSEYKAKDLALGIGKQAGYAAIQGAAISIGFDIAQRMWNGNEIETNEIIETAVKGGADFGIKAAVTGAIKVGVEKDIITVIPKETPASTIANIAFVAIEDAKILGKIVTGELSIKEGYEKIEQTTVAVIAGLVAMGEGAAKGAVIGTAIGTFLGIAPIGAAIGGFVGGTVAYMAGSKVGETVVRGAQKLRNFAQKAVESTISKIKDKCENVLDKTRKISSWIAELF